MWKAFIFVISIMMLGFGNNADAVQSRGGIEDMIRGAVEELRNQLKAGIPEKGIPPLDPMNITHQVINMNLKDVLRLNGSVDKVTGQNLLSFNITKLKAGITPISVEIRFDWDPISARGRYDVDGELLTVIPVYGDGDFSTYIDGVFAYFRLDIGTKAGTLRVKKFDVDFGLKNVSVNIENFLGGALSDIICEVINENLPTMVEQFKNGYLGYIKDAIVKAVNEFLKDKSFEDIMEMIQGLFTTTVSPSACTTSTTSAVLYNN